MTVDRDRRRTVTVVVVTVVAYACAVAVLVAQPAVLAQTGRLTTPHVVDAVGFITAFLGLPAVGAVLAVHRPSNPIGRTLLAFGAGLYLFLLVGGVTELVAVRTGTVAGAQLWMASLLTAPMPVLLALIVHLLLYFPDGELEGRARWLSRASTLAVSVLIVARLLRPGRLDTAVELSNPFGQAWAGPLDLMVPPLTAMVIALAVAALVRLVVRFRRADDRQRAQFRWILLSLGGIPLVILLTILVEVVVGNELVTTVVVIGGYNVCVLGFSYALYRAVTKQDLYGIGRVISRSVSYVLVLAVLASTYLVLVLGLGGAVRGATGSSSDLVVAVSTLAVAALFQPVRTRIRSVVDRRFNRARYDAVRTIDAFGRELRSEVSLDAVVHRLAEVSRGSFQPSVIGVTLLTRQQR